MDVPGFALITGAGSGIGRCCAKAFAREGAAGIALLDRNQEALDAVFNEIEYDINAKREKPCNLTLKVLDVSNEHEVDEAIKEVHQVLGRIDYVVNAAGIAMKHPGGAAFVKTDDWKRIIDVNLNGTFYVLRAAAQIMLKQERIKSSIDGRELQRGSIVNFSSILGVVGVSLSTAYTASKHAVTGLTRTASDDYAKDGLRINCICPGYTETPMTTDDPVQAENMREKVAHAVPMQRMGRPEELADGVLYLAGGRSSFVTGSALLVDGGYTSR